VTALIAIHFVICLFLVLVILLQPGKSDGGVGFGAASGSSQSIFGSRGAGNFLTKMTTGAACLFLVTSFFLTRERMKEFNSSVIKEEPASSAPAPSKEPVKTAEPEAKKEEAPKK
jgi:preprotein translocase subunit SecG